MSVMNRQMYSRINYVQESPDGEPAGVSGNN